MSSRKLGAGPGGSPLARSLDLGGPAAGSARSLVGEGVSPLAGSSRSPGLHRGSMGTMSEAGTFFEEGEEEETQGWAGAMRTLEMRGQQQEREQEALASRVAVQKKMHEEYVASRRFPVMAGQRSEEAQRRSGAMAYKQDRGVLLSERTRDNARPQLARSYSTDPKAVLAISQSTTARPMMFTTEDGLTHKHPWKLLASARAPNKEEKVPALKALLKLGREALIGAVQGGYNELIDRMIPGLEDPEPAARKATADILAEISEPGDEKVVDALIFAADDADDNVRVAGLQALKAVAPREVFKERCRSKGLRAALRRCTDVDPDVREAAVVAVGALGSFGSKTAIDAIIAALEDPAEAVNAAAVDALILIGDVFDQDPGNESLLEVRNLSVAPLSDDERSHAGSGWGGKGEVCLALGLEPPVLLRSTHLAPISALQQWILRFGVRGLEHHIARVTDDGRSKVLAMVEDCMVSVSGDVQLSGWVVLRWKDLVVQYRPIGSTPEDAGWAWEYRKQCQFGKGYEYVDPETGEVLLHSRMDFTEYFSFQGKEEEEEERAIVYTPTGEVVGEYTEQSVLQTAPRSVHGCEEEEGEGRPATSWYGDATQPTTAGFGAGDGGRGGTPEAGGVHWRGQQFDLHADDAEELKARLVVKLLGRHVVHKTLTKVIGEAWIPLHPLSEQCVNVSQALSTATESTWATIVVPLRLEAIDQEQPHKPEHPAIIAAALQSRDPSEGDEEGAGEEEEEAVLMTDAGDGNGGGKGLVEGWLTVEVRFSTAEDRIVSGILYKLEHVDLGVRRAALNAINNFIGYGNVQAVKGVLFRLEHPSHPVRASAVDALSLVARVGEADAIQGCLKRCSDPRPPVRASALEALCRVTPLSHKDVLLTLARLVADPIPEVRLVAQEILEQVAQGQNLSSKKAAAPGPHKVLELKLNWGDLGMLEKEEVAEKALQILGGNTCYTAFLTGPLSSRTSGLNKTSRIS